MKGKLHIVDSAPACASGVSMNIVKHDGSIAPLEFRGQAAVITLGCAKNQVDSEVMLGVLKNSGFEIVSDVAKADVAIINTCGFLESAIKESIDCILEVAEHKRTGRLRKLFVAGCLVERYKGDIVKELPEVDAFIGQDDMLRVGEVALGGFSAQLVEGQRPYFLYDDSVPRFLASKRHTAYVKISEGCNRPCTFCIIPRIRGAMRSRSVDSVVREVAALGAQGVREVNLVAQDLTSFGTDHKGGDLATLLQALEADGAVDWIRLLYAYPVGVDASLLETIVRSKRVCNYLDIPLQHVSLALLKDMKRPLGKFAPDKLVEFIRREQPEINIRTTFIVGFPGETEEHVRELEDFVRAGNFSSVGVFCYSPEPGTPAHDMSGQIPMKEKEIRRERVMLAQQEAQERQLQGYVGKRLRVLVEGAHDETELLLSGRTEFQAPEVDGTVIINDCVVPGQQIEPGSMGYVEITEVAGYDLIGTLDNTSSLWPHRELASSSSRTTPSTIS